MRYIAVTLIVLNLFLLYFNLSREQAAETKQELHRVEGNTTSIQLLREAGTSRKRQMEQVVNNPVQLVEEKETNCKAIGPFSSLTIGQAVLERLISMDLAVQLKALDSVLDEYYYRVLIPPVESLEVAFRNLRELQSLGIDSYVITQGEDSLGISMGVYSNAFTAEDVRRKLARDDYPTSIRQVSRIAREYWIFSMDDGDLEVGEEIMKSIQSKYPDANYGLQICVRETQESEE